MNTIDLQPTLNAIGALLTQGGIQPQNVVAFVLPLLVDYVTKKVVDSHKRFIIATVTCVISAFLLNLNLFFPFQWETLLANVSVVFTVSQLTYKLYWENSMARFNAKMLPTNNDTPSN